MKTYTIGEFAKLTDVTIRALRHYEKTGLLVPSRDPDNGYRRYTKNDMVLLEAILALKLVGFELSQIAELMRSNQSHSYLNLKNQKNALLRKIEELQHIVKIIERTSDQGTVDEIKLTDLIKLIKEMKMEKANVGWYLNQSKESIKEFGTGYPSNTQEKIYLQEKWKWLICKAEELKIEFSDEKFKELAKEWLDILYKCIGNNKEAVNGLLNLYSTMREWPAEKQLFDPELGAFIGPKLKEFHKSY